jgi:3-hydroxybutyryl-CoA dehydratase
LLCGVTEIQKRPRLIAKFTSVSADRLPVSLGYDRIRFIAPVFIGDTLNVAYTVTALNADRQRTTADILVTNQVGNKVAVAQHIMKWVTTTSSQAG